MKILQYYPLDHKYHKLAEGAEFRIDMDNGDAYDLKENGDSLNILSVHLTGARSLAIVPMSRFQVNLMPVLNK